MQKVYNPGYNFKIPFLQVQFLIFRKLSSTTAD